MCLRSEYVGLLYLQTLLDGVEKFWLKELTQTYTVESRNSISRRYSGLSMISCIL